MNRSNQSSASRLQKALSARDGSARLRAALAAGTHPSSEYVDVLVEQCAAEPDFFVRDMLTWALTRHDRSAAVERLLPELDSPVAQARSQALHTLSKIGDPSTWRSITEQLLRDADDEVARAAWRTAVALVPQGQHARLAAILATQLGRGDRDLQRSLSRAVVQLGTAGLAAIEAAKAHSDDGIRRHAFATEHLVEHPDADFDTAIAEANRITALLGVPTASE